MTAWRGRETGMLPGKENVPDKEYLGSAGPALESAVCG